MFSETTLGQIIVGIVIAIVTAAITGTLSWKSFSNEVPIVEIVPKSLNPRALEPVTFSAAGSRDPENEALTFRWKLGGLSLGVSSVGSCFTVNNNQELSCRFVMGGTHSVSVEATDSKGLSATAVSEVTVSMDGSPLGYLSLYVKSIGSENERKALLSALLKAVDWPKIQSMVGVPIVLFDPELPGPVYGSSLRRDVEAARSFIESGDIQDNIKIGGSGLRTEAKDAIILQAADAGISVTFFQLKFGDVFIATTTGIGDGGFILMQSPQELVDIYSNQ